MKEWEILHQIRRLDALYRREKHKKKQILYPEDKNTGGYGRILSALSEKKEGVSQKELAETLGIRPQSLTDALENLEREDLIERKRSETDKRQVMVKITKEGLKAEKHDKELRHEVSRIIFDCLTKSEKQVLMDILNKVNSQTEDREEDA